MFGFLRHPWRATASYGGCGIVLQQAQSETSPLALKLKPAADHCCAEHRAIALELQFYREICFIISRGTAPVDTSRGLTKPDFEGFIATQGFATYHVDEPPELGTVTFCGPHDQTPTWSGLLSERTIEAVITRFLRLAPGTRALLFAWSKAPPP